MAAYSNRKCGSRQTVHGRRGVVLVFVAVSMTVILAFAAIAVDLSLLYATKSELQRTADAGAMAGAWALLSDDRVRDDFYTLSEEARDAATAMAADNPVLQSSPFVHRTEDVRVGYWSDVTDPSAGLTYDSPAYNAVEVLVRRDAQRNGSITMTFAGAIGFETADLNARATAAFAEQIVGFRVTERSGNAGLMPFTLKKTAWDDLLAGFESTGDHYAWDEETQTLSSGGDGIPELNLYPGAGENQLPPGNFGTVDIGSPNNSTADLSRQILHGVSEADLAYFDGSLELGDNGTLQLNGDTGLSAGLKDELEAVKGQPRTLPLFTTVQGNGNNSMFTIVGFAGVRIMNVKLTGPMKNKELIIQPATVVDDAAVPGPVEQTSDYVYRPVQLVQ